ncbi:MAG: mechanosensitive ion channel [Nitrosomonadales bacterium]|mgnify:FL=1|jgi:small-conductance mechanosensitive channel|nr:mechanosensitive ion channel [Nitrosomonadales bacterium]MDC1281409.1 mechanosensitive ion channel [Methylophilaceae bacterium]|tara:strand:+ start:1569 stop:2846 length:1278 start_codon:yes stop_codon:yes gene_type:complete
MNKFDFIKNNLNVDYLLSVSVFMQAAALIVAGFVVFLTNKWIMRKIVERSKGNWKALGEGIGKIVSPFIFLIVVWLSGCILMPYQTVNILHVIQTLLIALIVIRLVVYLVKYILHPNPLLNAYQNFLSSILWVTVVLHLFGFLAPISSSLQSITFGFGDKEFSVLLVLQLLAGIFLSVISAMTLSRFIENRLMKVTQIGLSGRVMINKIVRIALYVIAIVVALDTIGLDLTFLSVFGGAFGVGLAFGMQKIASNYVSGFTILLDKSLQIGDILTIGEHYGIVDSIKSRYTVLRKLDGVEVIIPNETLIAENIINHTSSDRKVRVWIDIQVGYSSSVDLATEIMLSSCNQQERVIKDEPEPTVYLMNFGESGIDLKLVFYIEDAEEGTYRLKSDINKEIWREFQAKGIEIPFPQRVIHVENVKDFK